MKQLILILTPLKYLSNLVLTTEGGISRNIFLLAVYLREVIKDGDGRIKRHVCTEWKISEDSRYPVDNLRHLLKGLENYKLLINGFRFSLITV